MENKTQQAQSQNLQDTFLNHARRDRATVAIYLMSGVKLTGRIRGFDKYSVILESGNQEQMIFKHAISTVSIIRSSGYRQHDSHGHESRGGGEHRGDSSIPPAAPAHSDSGDSGGQS